ncbi:MAG: hypothetical protein FWC87_01085 [Acidimicrobiaceae bacterium]|nr:hypothetical protein [Acidimicrobiaceae bacterium]
MPLSPVQRNLLLYGAPVVIIFGLYAFLRARSASNSAGASGVTTTTSSGTTTADNSPIGVDQLTSFENQMVDALGTVQNEITGSQSATGATTSGTTSVAPPPSPVPASTVPVGASTPTTTTPAANLYPVGTSVAPGETIVQAVPAGSGYVDVTSKGGLYGSGVSVSGSMITASPPAGAQYSAKVSGDTVLEYGPGGVAQFKIG